MNSLPKNYLKNLLLFRHGSIPYIHNINYFWINWYFYIISMFITITIVTILLKFRLQYWANLSKLINFYPPSKVDWKPMVFWWFQQDYKLKLAEIRSILQVKFFWKYSFAIIPMYSHSRGTTYHVQCVAEEWLRTKQELLWPSFSPDNRIFTNNFSRNQLNRRHFTKWTK